MVKLQCQRCMSPVQVGLAPRAWVELVDSDAALDADDDDKWDALRNSERFDLLHLLEDELLLALPYAPMHDKCEPAASTTAGEKIMPFAALARLKVKGTA